MKKIIFTFFLFTSFNAYALPDCPDDISATWNNCFGFSNMGNDGDTYEGEWKNNVRHGQGTYTFADGDKYLGNYKDGKRHGQGAYTWSDGRRETGFYMNNEYIPDICEDMGLSVNSSGYEKCINRLIEEVLD